MSIEKLFLTQFNNNTSVLDTYPNGLSSDQLYKIANPKIRNRLSINLSNLNGLATTVVTPEAISIINQDSLHKILDFSNQANKSIGLPSSDSLIIRSSIPSFVSPNKRKNIELSEPALLVTNLNSTPKFKLMERNSSPKTVEGLGDFTKILPARSFLLVHDDNYDLQINGIHGVICDQRRGAELYLRTGSLQARNMGDSSMGHPTIRINANRHEDLFLAHPVDGYNAVNNSQKLENSRFTLTTQNCTSNEAVKLVTAVKTNSELIVQSHHRAQKLFNSEVSTEFRIYPNLSGYIGQRLHVLDVN